MLASCSAARVSLTESASLGVLGDAIRGQVVRDMEDGRQRDREGACECERRGGKQPRVQSRRATHVSSVAGVAAAAAAAAAPAPFPLVPSRMARLRLSCRRRASACVCRRASLFPRLPCHERFCCGHQPACHAASPAGAGSEKEREESALGCRQLRRLPVPAALLADSSSHFAS